jgi:hypothetical protein
MIADTIPAPSLIIISNNPIAPPKSRHINHAILNRDSHLLFSGIFN